MISAFLIQAFVSLASLIFKKYNTKKIVFTNAMIHIVLFLLKLGRFDNYTTSDVNIKDWGKQYMEERS